MPDQAVGIHDRIRMVNGTMGAPEAVVFFFFLERGKRLGLVVIPPETKQFAPEKWLGSWEYYFPIGMTYFQVRTVSL